MITVPEGLSESHRTFLELRHGRITRLGETLDALYPDPAGLVLEIGCGHGHYLTAYAQQHPTANCVGVDLVTKRIQKACQKRDKRKLANLQFFKADAREFLEAWPERLTLERIFVLFPDPWPKKRHVKNRILQPALLDTLAAHSRPGTALHFRTDHEATFEYGLETIAAHGLWSVDDEAEWPFENPSFFQDLFSGYQSLTALFAPPAGAG